MTLTGAGFWVGGRLLLPGDIVTPAPADRPDPVRGEVLSVLGDTAFVSWPRPPRAVLSPEMPVDRLARWQPLPMPGPVFSCQFCQGTTRHTFHLVALGAPESDPFVRFPSGWPRPDVCGSCAELRTTAGQAVLDDRLRLAVEIVDARRQGCPIPVLLVPPAGGTMEGAGLVFGVPVIESASVDRATVTPEPQPDPPTTAHLPHGADLGSAAMGPQLATDMEAFLRRIARPATADRAELAIDAASLLRRLGATCNVRHIGPFYRVPGSDSLERCLTCGEVIGK